MLLALPVLLAAIAITVTLATKREQSPGFRILRGVLYGIVPVWTLCATVIAVFTVVFTAPWICAWLLAPGYLLAASRDLRATSSAAGERRWARISVVYACVLSMLGIGILEASGREELPELAMVGTLLQSAFLWLRLESRDATATPVPTPVAPPR